MAELCRCRCRHGNEVYTIGSLPCIVDVVGAGPYSDVRDAIGKGASLPDSNANDDAGSPRFRFRLRSKTTTMTAMHNNPANTPPTMAPIKTESLSLPGADAPSLRAGTCSKFDMLIIVDCTVVPVDVPLSSDVAMLIDDDDDVGANVRPDVGVFDVVPVPLWSHKDTF